MIKSIVIDINIIISALIDKEGPSRQVLRLCLQGGHYQPLMSNALFQEYEDVSSREHILELCPLSSSEIRAFLNAIYSISQWVPIYYLWRPTLSDAGDNFLIELAVAGGADYIITSNAKDLKSAELSFKQLKIITPEVFLRGH